MTLTRRSLLGSAAVPWVERAVENLRSRQRRIWHRVAHRAATQSTAKARDWIISIPGSAGHWIDLLLHTQSASPLETLSPATPLPARGR